MCDCDVRFQHQCGLGDSSTRRSTSRFSSGSSSSSSACSGLSLAWEIAVALESPHFGAGGWRGDDGAGGGYGERLGMWAMTGGGGRLGFR